MTLSMGGFAIEDLFLKILSETVPVSQILVYVGLSATFLMGFISIIKGIPILGNNIIKNKFFIIRCISDMMGAVLTVTSISLLPLSTVSSIFTSTPTFHNFWSCFNFQRNCRLAKMELSFFWFFRCYIYIKT